MFNTFLALLLAQQSIYTDEGVHLVGALVDLEESFGMEVNDFAIAGKETIRGFAI